MRTLFTTNRVFAQALRVIALFAIIPFSQWAQRVGGDVIWEREIYRFNPPSDPSLWPAWRTRLNDWRKEQKQKHNNNHIYYKRGFEWAPACYAMGFSVIYDSQFYNQAAGEYNVEGLVDYYKREYGGLDAITIWPLSPQIGFDDRNQYDFYRNMPGGLAGLRKAVDRFHAYGVKVLINNNPVDEGSFRNDNLRPESPENPGGQPEGIANIVRAIDADGIFLNTYSYGGDALRRELDKIRPGIVVEAEINMNNPDQIMKQHMEWWSNFKFKDPEGWFNSPYVPGAVLRNKWLERKHMMHMHDRATKDHSRELHIAWLNGAGMLVWENVFGIWRGWSQRDRSMLRSMLPVQRRYALLFSGESWTPLVPTLRNDVFASLWECEKLRLWTVINHADDAVNGAVIRVPHREADRYFELISGAEMKPVIQDGSATLDLSMHGKGVAGILGAPSVALGPDFDEFLAGQKKLKQRENLSTEYPAIPVVVKPFRRTKPLNPSAAPKGMQIIPAIAYTQVETITKRESGTYNNEVLSDGGSFSHPVKLSSFAIDMQPVTNADFERFLKASGYTPKHKENFLKHWDNGRPPKGKEMDPVVYVDLDDARAYAASAGKRLPTKEEWQYAMETGKAHYGRTRVWEWNESERTDGRTRFCFIKGGCDWLARGSVFYAPGYIPPDKQNGHQTPDYAAKFMLMWPGLDRLWTIGFRCAVDLEP